MGGAKVIMVTSSGHTSAVFDPANMNGELSYSRFVSYYNSKLYNVRHKKGAVLPYHIVY